MSNLSLKRFYEENYGKLGLSAQRKYPSEELCRFIGRNYSSISLSKRSRVKILKVSFGAGADMWMLAREGLDIYGVDLSPTSVKLAQKMLASYHVNANMCTARGI